MLIDFMPVSLVDYPGHIAATVFIAGCNLCCPYCHNAALIEQREQQSQEDTLFSYLAERRHLINGVCITGGEPTLWSGLKEFINKLKKEEFDVKLDTNGTRPSVISDLINNSIIDYIAMDIKTTPEHYHTFGAFDQTLKNISQSVELIKQSNVAYEFRTTVHPQMLSLQMAIDIGKWLQGAQKYVLQGYKYSESILNSQLCGMENCSLAYLEELQGILSPYLQNIIIRH